MKYTPSPIRSSACLVLFVAYLLLNTLHAAEVTFEFTASVTDVIDPMGLSGLEAGNQIDGTYTFEDTTIGRGLFENSARYDNAVTDAQINLGNLQLTGIVASTLLNDNRIDVGDAVDFGNGNIQDVYDVQQLKLNPLSICPTTNGAGGVNLRANSPSSFITGISIPQNPPDISLADRLNTTTFIACHGAPEEVVVRGVMTSLDLAATAPALSCVGFESPMDAGSVKVKKNRVLPLKGQMFDLDGFDMTDADIAASPMIQVLFDSGVGDAIDVTEEALAAGEGSEGNEFEFGVDYWRFNLKTSNYTAPGTYTITMVSGDATEYVIDPSCAGSFVIE